jgi:hypothetical protein
MQAGNDFEYMIGGANGPSAKFAATLAHPPPIPTASGCELGAVDGNRDFGS